MKPCPRLALVSRRITGSPFLSVITLGENSNFFAVISITFGLSARARLPFGGTVGRAIPHAPASSIVLTILFLNIFVFTFLLVLCVVVSVFEHLIHSDCARELS